MNHSSSEGALRVVIPARYASSRLPGKPLVDLAGLPMVVRVFQRVQVSLPDVDIIVATDDQRIVQVLEQYAIPCVMTCNTHESGSDRAAEVARIQGWADKDIIMNVQGDEPLLPVELLQAFAQFCCSRQRLEMASVVAPLSGRRQIEDTNIVKVVLNQNDDALMFTRSAVPFCRDLARDEWLLEDFSRHIGIYAYRNENLQRLTAAPVCRLEKLEKLEQLRALWHGMKISMMRWHITPPHGVDTPEDVQRVIETLS